MEASRVLIRDAAEPDISAVLAIYNHVIATSTAVWTEEPYTLENRLDWWRSHRNQGYPVIVAVDASGVTGFAALHDFRQSPGYRFTAEHSVHVRADCRGRGIGGLLMLELMERARAMGKHVMIGGVDAANEGSIRFHQRLGFEQVAYFREVGFKFGRWLDLVFLELRLEE